MVVGKADGKCQGQKNIPWLCFEWDTKRPAIEYREEARSQPDSGNQPEDSSGTSWEHSRSKLPPSRGMGLGRVLPFTSDWIQAPTSLARHPWK